MCEKCRAPLSDDEFDKVQALYDALYRVFTEPQRDTFFAWLVPPLDDAPRPLVASVPLPKMPRPANDRR